MTSTPVEVARRWFEEMWNHGRAELIPELLAADAPIYDVGAPGDVRRGPEGFRPTYEKLRGAFPDIQFTIEEIISERDIVPNRSSGYEWVKGELKNQEWVSPSYNSTADGALYFNILDLAKWDAALYTEKLLKKASLDRMWTVFPLNDGKLNRDGYGFAWRIGKTNGHTLIEHGGAWQGFSTHIARYVDDALSVVVLANLDSGHAHPGKIAHDVAGLYDSALIPSKP